MIADAWRHLSDSAAAKSTGAKREALASTGQRPEHPRKRRPSIRRPARIRPLRKELDPASSLNKRTGASPSCLQEYLTTPAFNAHPFRFAHASGCGRFPSGALTTPFIQQQITHSMILIPCKGISEKGGGRQSLRRGPWWERLA